MISNRTVLEIVIATWLVVISLYLIYTPIGANSHDFIGHVEFTKIIATQHRLPAPYEGWEGYQPPLYYFINSFFSKKSLNSDTVVHCNYVRAISVLYGAIALLLIAWVLNDFAKDNFYKLLVLLFISTTPKFAFIFSTYNNDSLSMLLAIAVAAVSYKLHRNFSKKLALVLLLVATAALYSKLSAGASILAVIIICCRKLFNFKNPSPVEIRIVSILIFSVLLLLPWAFFHNYHYLQKLFPLNSQGLGQNVLYEKGQAIKIVLPTAIFQNNEHKWDEPWVYPSPHPASKRFDYWSYSFVNSVIGEFTYNSPSARFVWIVLLAHLFIYLLALKDVFKSNSSKLAGSVILLGHLSQIIYFLFSTTSCGMDYRYVCWTWIGWAVLYTNMLSNNSTKILSKVMVLIIALHIYFMMNIS